MSRRSVAVRGPQIDPTRVGEGSGVETIIPYGYGDGHPVTAEELVHTYGHTSPDLSRVVGYIPLTSCGEGHVSAHDSAIFMPSYPRAVVRSSRENPPALSISGRLAHIVLPLAADTGGLDARTTKIVISDRWASGHTYRNYATILAGMEGRYEPLGHIGQTFAIFEATGTSSRWGRRNNGISPLRYELKALMGGGDANPASYFFDDNVRSTPLAGNRNSSGWLSHMLQAYETAFMKENGGERRVHAILDHLIDVGAKANVELEKMRPGKQNSFYDLKQRALKGQGPEVRSTFQEFMRVGQGQEDPSRIVILMKAAAQRTLAGSGRNTVPFSRRPAYNRGVETREGNIRKEVLEAILQAQVLNGFERDQDPEGANEFSPVRAVAKYLDGFEVATIMKLAAKITDPDTAPLFQAMYRSYARFAKKMDGGVFFVQSTAEHYPLDIADSLAGSAQQRVGHFNNLPGALPAHTERGVSVADIIASVKEAHKGVPLMMDGILGKIVSSFTLGGDVSYPHAFVPISLDVAPAALMQGIHKLGLFESHQQGIPDGVFLDDLLTTGGSTSPGLFIGSQTREGNGLDLSYRIGDGTGVQWVRTPTGEVIEDPTKAVKSARRPGRGEAGAWQMRSVSRQAFPKGSKVIGGAALLDTVTYVAYPRSADGAGQATTLAMPNPAFGSTLARPKAITIK